MLILRKQIGSRDAPLDPRVLQPAVCAKHPASYGLGYGFPDASNAAAHTVPVVGSKTHPY